jgi:hypothetical protein
VSPDKEKPNTFRIPDEQETFHLAAAAPIDQLLTSVFLIKYPTA